eukprot:90762-Pelagomonas_calceolata.AAC.1
MQPHTHLVVQQAQLGMQGAAAADDASHAVCGERDEGQQHTSVDGEVVHALHVLLQHPYKG